jgi:BirA family biotin operon repressor/biotin-[acetyl-CoA-carboxylase] ligase
MIDEKILKVLRLNTDSYVSSEELCKMAGISRAAIWKHMEKLRDEGYEIEASPHLGYKLIDIPDSLIPAEIKWGLKTKTLGREVISYKRIDSTNDAAYALAEKGVKEGTVVLAEEQAKGKGRLGRGWVSPANSGIYLSAILRPDITPSEIPKITLLAAVAVAEAIRDFSGLPAMIKWPNDILVNGKKVCGILTEMKAEQDSAAFVIVGIGVNVNTSSGQLPKNASSLKEELKKMGQKDMLSRVTLTRKMLEELDRYYVLLKREGFSPIIEAWKDLSAMLGSRVKVSLQDSEFEAMVHDLDPDGSLVVRLHSGVLKKITSGDIIVIK